jgi:hypothetical protein
MAGLPASRGGFVVAIVAIPALRVNSLGGTWASTFSRSRAFLFMMADDFVSDIGAWGMEMAKKIMRSRPWTKEDVRMLKTLARERAKKVIAALRLETYAECGCGVSAGIKAGRDVGRRSREEEGVRGTGR